MVKVKNLEKGKKIQPSRNHFVHRDYRFRVDNVEFKKSFLNSSFHTELLIFIPFGNFILSVK